MASGSISDASAPPLFRDSTKKKKTNGSAKLKQIKLDVRREQWLSRVKKGCSNDSNEKIDYCLSCKHIASEENGSSNKANRRKRGEDAEGSSNRDSVMGSMVNNPTQSSFDCDESGNGLSGRSSSNSGMNTCFSGNVSEEEEEDGCLDDWEAVADALNGDYNLHTVVSESPTEHEMQYISAVANAAKNPGVDLSKTELRSAIPESHPNCRAWKPDDALRPGCLPSIIKKHGTPSNPNWHHNHKTIAWAWQSIISQPSQCPICYEDLDVTDSIFLPCSCGFRLCLFCHKRILEADGRCPGCRKLYDHIDANVGFNIAEAFCITQSCSMSTGC